MIYRATELIHLEFDRIGIRHGIREMGHFSGIETHYSGKNCIVELYLFSNDNCLDVKVLSMPITKCPKEKLEIGYCLLNELNRKYRFAKFLIDSKGAIRVEYDFPEQTSEGNLGPVSTEITTRCFSIIDEAYPVIVKTLWPE